MSDEVLRIINLMDLLPAGQHYHSVGDFLNDFPQFTFNPNVVLSLEDKQQSIYKDLMKQASSRGEKRLLKYNLSLLLPLIQTEQIRLMNVSNVIKRILNATTARRNKQLILEIVEHCLANGERFVTGGGTKLATKRVIMIYEQEGRIQPVRRAAPRNNEIQAHPANNEENDERKEEEVNQVDDLDNEVNPGGVGLTNALDEFTALWFDLK